MSIPLLEMNAKVKFRRQLENVDTAIGFLSDEINALQAGVPEVESGAGENLRNKLEYVLGGLECFKGVKKALFCRDVALDQRFEDLRGLPQGNPEKDEVEGDYNQMTAVLSKIEVNIYRILAVEDEWFSLQTYRMRRWIRENPKLAAGIVSISAGFCAGMLGILSENGIHLVHAIGLSPVALAVGPSIVTGAVCGLLVGGVVLLSCHLFLSRREYRKVTEQAAEQAATIQRMVNAIGALPSSQFQQELQTLMGEHDKMESILPAFEDRKCFFCLGEGSEVKYPVKTASCRGQHFMCRVHFMEWIQTSRGSDLRCSICRV